MPPPSASVVVIGSEPKLAPVGEPPGVQPGRGLRERLHDQDPPPPDLMMNSVARPMTYRT
jgi:hypothetical protein